RPCGVQFDHLETVLRGLSDHLGRRLTRIRHTEGHPQRFVPSNNLNQRPVQRTSIDRTLQPKGGTDVVRRRRPFELVEKPQSFLRKRHRRRCPWGPRLYRTVPGNPRILSLSQALLEG